MALLHRPGRDYPPVVSTNEYSNKGQNKGATSAPYPLSILSSVAALALYHLQSLA